MSPFLLLDWNGNDTKCFLLCDFLFLFIWVSHEKMGILKHDFKLSLCSFIGFQSFKTRSAPQLSKELWMDIQNVKKNMYRTINKMNKLTLINILTIKLSCTAKHSNFYKWNSQHFLPLNMLFSMSLPLFLFFFFPFSFPSPLNPIHWSWILNGKKKIY